MAEYQIGEKLKIRRYGSDKLELNINGNKTQVFTEDLACLVREELPKDRGDQLFAEIQERALSRGKARVIVKAHKNIKKNEEVCFMIDISKYTDGSGVRATESGILF